MRSTGEVMASAADLPTALAKAERAAGRPLPTSGTAFLSVRDDDKPSVVADRAPRSRGSASSSSRRRARRGRCARRASTSRRSRRSRTPTTGEETVVDLVRDGRCDLVVNTPQGSGARADGYLIREAALVARVPCITTISGAAAAVHAIANARAESALSLPGADRNRGVTDAVLRRWPRAAARSSGDEAVGPYTLLRLERGGLEPGVPGQFFMLEAPGRLLRGR